MSNWAKNRASHPHYLNSHFKQHRVVSPTKKPFEVLAEGLILKIKSGQEDLNCRLSDT